jgi:hypothetical protein
MASEIHSRKENKVAEIDSTQHNSPALDLEQQLLGRLWKE